MPIAIVVLTHYNRAHLLRQCVENVLSRTSAETEEIVIWDNASTDDTAPYLDSLTDPRIRVVHHPSNIGQNAYREAFALTSSEYMVELDDDVIDAPPDWDRILLDAFCRLPEIGFLAADLVDDEHDSAARVRYHVRPHLYVPVEVNGVRLLEGPTGGGCAMTSRTINRLAGGFRQDKKRVFWLEDAAYIKDIERVGYRAAVLRDLRVHHAGGAYYSKPTEARAAFWDHYARQKARKAAIKRMLIRIPGVRRLNRRYSWFEEPTK